MSPFVVFAALSFGLSGYPMKLSDGFAQAGPKMLMFMLVAFGLQTWAMRNEHMNSTYMTVLGLEAITAF